MKILLTGHRGYIGKVMNYWLHQLGHEVKGYEWADGTFPDVSGYNHVIHLGANSSTTEKDVERVMVMNHDFSCKLLIACNQAGVDLMYASSASVYGNTKGSGIEPLNPYAWTKYLFDRLVEKNLSQKLNIKVQGFRLFNVWGVIQAELHKKDQASLFTKFHGKDKITLFKGSENIKRDFIHVVDICNIMIAMMANDKSGIYDLGTGVQKSFLDLANTMIESDLYAPKEIEWIDFPEHLKGRYQFETKCHNAKLITQIGSYDFRMIEENDTKPEDFNAGYGPSISIDRDPQKVT